MDDDAARLLAVVRSGGDVRAAWRQLFECDAVIASSVAFDLLAGEPRTKPSRALVVDPGDTVRRRWEVRVAAAAALLESPVAVRVFDELCDELAENADLAVDVLTVTTPYRGLTDRQLAALRALGPPTADPSPR